MYLFAINNDSLDNNTTVNQFIHHLHAHLNKILNVHFPVPLSFLPPVTKPLKAL